MSDFFIGLAMLFVGLASLFYVYKYPSEETIQSNLKIWLGGLGLVVIGLLLLLGIAEFK